MYRRIHASFVGALAGFVGFVSAARGDLSDEAQQLAEAWRAEGWVVERQNPVFVDQGKLRSLLTDIPSRKADPTGCTTVALLAERGLHFQLRFPYVTLPVSPDPRGTRPSERSLAGLLTLVRCGERQDELSDIAVEMIAARGTIEVVTARGRVRASPVHDTLIERAVAPSRPLADPGRAPGQETMTARLARAQQRAKHDGAVHATQGTLQTSIEGNGRALFRLRPGCHRIELLAPWGARQQVMDVDAEMRDALTNRLLARDRGDTPDARVETCVGEPTVAVIMFGGATPSRELPYLHTMWPLPPGIPTTWGARAQAAFAKAIARRHAPWLQARPLATALGGSGTTVLPLEVESNRCYLLALAPVRGELRTLTVSVDAGATLATEDTNPLSDGAALAFCTRGNTRAMVQVDARGTGLAWALALWPLGTSSPERNGTE